MRDGFRAPFCPRMTVGRLRRLLETLPDELPLVYEDDGIEYAVSGINPEWLVWDGTSENGTVPVALIEGKAAHVIEPQETKGTA